MGKWKHRMLLIDENQMEGECAHCGDVPIIWKTKRWACALGVKEQKGNKGRHGVPLDLAKELREGIGECQLCGSTKQLALDHNHVTGKLRGVLCFHCNAGLGHFKDNKEILRKAITYLDGYFDFEYKR